MLKKAITELFVPHPKQILPLDGLRSMAILLVVLTHTSEMVVRQLNGLHPLISQIPPFKGGWTGVQLFFVLSGFLIGGQLWREFQKRKNIGFTAFFLRRGFRIWPLYYAVLIIGYLFPVVPGRDDIFSNIFFLSNYLGDNGPVFYSWSLATEEQFYIITPILFILVGKLNPPKSISSFRPYLLLLFFFPTLFRYIEWQYFSGLNTFDINYYMKEIYRPIHTNSEGLIIGLLISNLKEDPSIHLKKIHKLFYFLGLLVCALSFKSKIIFNFLGISIFFALSLYYCLTENDFITKFLSMRIFHVIAKLSFGAYLLNWPILYFMEKFDLLRWSSLNANLQVLSASVICLAITFILCSLTYILIEFPFLKLRELALQRINPE